MTEAQWLACGESKELIHFLPVPCSARKLSLWGFACCSRIAHFVTDSRYQTALEFAASYAEDVLPDSERGRVASELVAAVRVDLFPSAKSHGGLDAGEMAKAWIEPCTDSGWCSSDFDDPDLEYRFDFNSPNPNISAEQGAFEEDDDMALPNAQADADDDVEQMRRKRIRLQQDAGEAANAGMRGKHTGNPAQFGPSPEKLQKTTFTQECPPACGRGTRRVVRNPLGLWRAVGQRTHHHPDL